MIRSIFLPIAALACLTFLANASYAYHINDIRSDYELRPTMEAEYLGLDASLQAGFDGNNITGEVTYRLRPRHAFVDTLRWMAPGVFVSDVLLDGRRMSYEHYDEHLVLAFEGYLDLEQTISVTVRYEADPVFGLHYTAEGFLFSSRLPGANSHWLPGPVHPRVRMPAELSIELPAGKTAVTGGEFMREEMNGDRRISHWVWERAVPITDLAFAAGNFEHAETFSGAKSIRVYHPEGTFTGEERQNLLGEMIQQIRLLEREMRAELPVTAFHAVVLPDDRWETVSYSAGMGYLFTSAGKLNVQMVRALSAQWFGVMLAPARWQDLPYIVMLQAMLAERIGADDWLDVAGPLEQSFDIPSTIYSYGTMNYWQWARHFVKNESNRLLTDVFDHELRDLAREPGVWSSEQFASFVYDRIGLWTTTPSITRPPPSAQFRYRVRIEESSTSGDYSIDIHPVGDITEDDKTLEVEWAGTGNTTSRTLVFRGEGEMLNLAIGSRTNNIMVRQPDSDYKHFMVEKPFSMWFHQLRNAQDSHQRAEAARALVLFQDEPDLQLAVQDIINRENDPQVLAALLETMSALTQGASGTERQFIDALSHSSLDVRLAAMQALVAYEGNQRVQDQVFSVIQSSDDLPLVNHAIRTYRHLVDQNTFRRFALQFLREDRNDLDFTPTLLDALYEIEVVDETVDATLEYVRESYPFAIRWKAYNLLRSRSGNRDWEQNFLHTYIKDPDPRIRYLSLLSVSSLSLSEQESFLESAMLSEFDQRLLLRMRFLADSM